MDGFVRLSIADTLNLTLDDVAYTGPLFRSLSDKSPLYSILFVSAVQFTLTTTSLFLVVYFGMKCYFHIGSFTTISDSVSMKLKNLQKQLFLALVFQALIPVVLMHIPVTILYTCSLINVTFNPINVATTIALFPALDPFPTIFIVKTYRMTVFGFFAPFLKCLRRKPNEISAGSK